MDPNMSKIVYGLPGRDEEIAKIKQTIVNMRQAGHSGAGMEFLQPPRRGRL